MRSPLFNLKIQNVVFWLFVPTYFAQKAYNNNIEQRIENMWRTHRNRVDNGLGGTYHGSGSHESLDQDKNFRLLTAHITTDMIYKGAIGKSRFDNPFLRWHQSFEDYPAHHSDMDDYIMHETDDFERMKQFKPDKKNVVGVTPIIPK